MATQQTFNLLGDPAQYYQLVQQGVSVEPPIDLQSPLTYKDWLSYNPTILAAQKVTSYNDYLQGWYASYYQTLDTSQQIYQDYTALVSSLVKIFGDDNELKKISSLDLTDEFQLSVAIPHLSKKLKEIAVYYLNKRSDVKTAKLRYNMIGSNTGIERIMHNNILKAFAKGPQTITLDDAAWTHLPQLTAVNSSFTIEVRELYDQNEYLDKSPSKSYDYPQTDNDWIYNTGLYSLTSVNPLIFTLASYIENAGVLFADQLPASCFDTGDVSGTLNVYNQSELASRFIGTTQYFATGGYTTPVIDQFTFDIQQGTNIFYWPYGEYYLEAPNTMQYEPMYLSDTSFIADGATAGTTIDTADVIWVNDGNSLSGAWLCDFSNSRAQATMHAELKRNKTTIFKFPFSGYGTVSERQSWTGKQLSNFDIQQTKTNSVQAQQLYWSDVSTVSTADPISIHDTTLLQSGARASQNYFDADKITIRTDTSDGVHDAKPNNVYNGSSEVAWLYHPLYTQLPIAEGETLIYWPYFTGAEAEQPALQISSYYATTIMLSATDSTIAFRGAIANSAPSAADTIDMLDCGKVVMRAWLSGCNITQALPRDTNNWTSGIIQPGLNVKLESNKWTKFVYDAPDRTTVDITDIASFVGHDHQVDCPYLQATKKSLIKGRLGIDQSGCNTWEKCTCKAVYYSPFGHNGTSYDDNYRLSDVIMVDTQYPDVPNINTWIGRDGLSYKHSSDFAWYYLSGNPEPDVGWGKGSWKTGSGSPMQLIPGERYVYFRIATCCDQPGPPLVVSHSYCYCGSITKQAKACSLCVNPYVGIPLCDCESVTIDYCCKPVWVGMSPLADGTWISTNRHSEMPLIAGQKYRYTHRGNTTFTWTTTADDKKHTIDVKALDFLITQPLSGWSADSFTYSPTSSGAYPYWATIGSNRNGKGINCGTANSPISPSPYLLVTNPIPSRVVFDNNTYVEYHRVDADTIVWIQPVDLTVNNPSKKWCHIEIDQTHIDPIITDMHISNCNMCRTEFQQIKVGACGCPTQTSVTMNFGCNAHRMVVSATDIPSQIVLNGKTLCNEYTTISYCAASAFSTTQQLVNISVPYTYNAPVTGIFADTFIPWENIANRHFPTVATFTITSQLSSRDQYGLFDPSIHGTLIFEGSQYQNTIELQGSQLTQIVPFVDPYSWNNSRGLTHQDNNQLILTKANDCSWFKMSPFNGRFSGGIIGSETHQTFAPYQALQQTHQFFNGFRTDKYSSQQDSTSADFHGYYNEQQWQQSQPNITDTLTNWSTDLFGNQYMLVKPLTSAQQQTSISYGMHFNRVQSTGTLWVRTLNDDIVAATTALSSMFTKYLALSSSVHSQLTGNGIVDMQMFNNTMMIVLSGHVLFEKIDYDFDSNQIVTSDDATVIYNFAPNKGVSDISMFGTIATNIKMYNHLYAGHWYDPQHNKLLIVTSAQVSTTNLPYIIIHSLDLATHRFTQIYPKTQSDVTVWSEKDSTFGFSSYPVNAYGDHYVLISGSPVVTVNKDTNQLICHFLVRGRSYRPSHAVWSKKMNFVSAFWQLTPTLDEATLTNIDVKSAI